MQTHAGLLRVLCLAGSVVGVLNGWPAGAASPPLVTASGLSLRFGDRGDVAAVSCGDHELPCRLPGGFYMQDYGRDRKGAFRPFPLTVAARAGGGVDLTGTWPEAQLRLEAEVRDGGDALEVSGSLLDTSGQDRAIWLQFRLPFEAKGWRWWDSLRSVRPVGEGAPCATTYYPLPTAAGPETGLALAIPPTAPSAFLAGCDEDGLWLKWPLGLAAETREPARARFHFLIKKVDATWGFRDTLAWYYGRYDEYYRLPPEQMKKWGHDQIWARAGDRSKLPADRRDAPCMAYFNFSGKVRTSLQTNGTTEAGFHDMLRTTQLSTTWYDEDPETAQDVFLNSALHDPAGHVQRTLEGGTYRFPMNPDPDLFGDRAAPVQGAFLLATIDRLAASGAIESLHFDTVGAWGMYLNYRREHFVYAAHPLTFDEEGRVCLYNKISLYEFFSALRTQAHARGVRIEAAGMKAYAMKQGHPPGMERDGRFFTAALVDSAWHEGNFKPLDDDGYDLERIYLGRKSYRVSSGNILKHQQLPTEEKIRRALAQNTAWGFAVPICDSYFAKPGYDRFDPDYARYERDRALWDRYLPAGEALRLAGWEPVTQAQATGRGVVCERFGSSGEIYFTLWAPEPLEQTTLRIDLTALGLEAAHVQVKDLILDHGLQEVSREGGVLVLSATLERDMTRVLRLSASRP